MYVAVKGGERAIENAHAFLAEERRGDTSVAELSIAQIREQLRLAVNRVMAEGSLYDADLAALAIKQSRGDLIEAVFLIRAYRTTLARFGASNPVDTGRMACVRRISATFKDAPGGQVLGPTFDYTHRLLDFKLLAEGAVAVAPQSPALPADVPHITSFLNRDGLIEAEVASDATPPDLTREPLELPASRPLRLQAITRGDEGFILSLACSTQRGYGRTHAFVGELRIGLVPVDMHIPELGFAVEIGEVELTECETVNQFKGSRTQPPQFTRGYGLVFGTRKMHELEDYGLMHVKLYEDIARHGTIATAYDYPVKVAGRYVMDPSPIPKFDNPKLNDSPALQLFGAGREQRIYAVPPYTSVVSLDFDDHPFTPTKADHDCDLCGSGDSYLDEVIMDDQGGRMFVCSDTDYCGKRRGAGHLGQWGAGHLGRLGAAAAAAGPGQ